MDYNIRNINRLKTAKNKVPLLKKEAPWKHFHININNKTIPVSEQELKTCASSITQNFIISPPQSFKIRNLCLINKAKQS